MTTPKIPSKTTHFNRLCAELGVLGATASYETFVHAHIPSVSMTAFTVDKTTLNEQHIKLMHVRSEWPRLRIWDGFRFHSLPMLKDGTFNYIRAAKMVLQNTVETAKKYALRNYSVQNTPVVNAFHKEHNPDGFAADKTVPMGQGGFCVSPSTDLAKPLMVRCDIYAAMTAETAATLLSTLRALKLVD